MRRFSLFIILCALMQVLYFSSCGEDENDDDKQRPKIEHASMNVNDTLYVTDINYSPQEMSLKLNDSLNVNHEIDTLTIGKWMYINAGFSDDKSLSTFKVELKLKYRSRPDEEGKQKELDSLFVKLGRNIYGKDSIVVNRNRLLLLTDTLNRNIDSTPFRLGLVEGDYPLKVVCVDVSGKRDSVIFPVRVLLRKTIYNGRLK